MEPASPDRSAAVRASSSSYSLVEFIVQWHLSSNDEHQRWEPAATDARIATDLNGWLPSAGCCG
jgi:hypothetical protein